MRRLINLVESAQHEQLDEGVKEKIMSMGLAAALFTGSVNSNDLAKEKEHVASIAVNQYIMNAQTINKVQDTKEFKIFAKSTHLLRDSEMDMLNSYERGIETWYKILKIERTAKEFDKIRYDDNEIEIGTPGDPPSPGYLKMNIPTIRPDPSSILQRIENHITGDMMWDEKYQAAELKQMFSDEALTAEEQRLVNEIERRQHIYNWAKKDKIHLAALVELYVHLKKTSPNHFIFSRTEEDVAREEKYVEKMIKDGF